MHEQFLQVNWGLIVQLHVLSLCFVLTVASFFVELVFMCFLYVCFVLENVG